MATLAFTRGFLAGLVAVLVIASTVPGLATAQEAAPGPQQPEDDLVMGSAMESADEVGDAMEERKLGLLKLWKKTPSPKFGKWWKLDFKKATPLPTQTTASPTYYAETAAPSTTPPVYLDNWWKLDNKKVDPVVVNGIAPYKKPVAWNKLNKYKDYDLKYYDKLYAYGNNQKATTPAPKVTTTQAPELPIYKGVEFRPQPDSPNLFGDYYGTPYVSTTMGPATTTTEPKFPGKLLKGKFDWRAVDCKTFKATQLVGGWDAYEYCWKASHTLCEKKKLKYFTCFWKDYTDCTKCLDATNGV